VKAARVTLWGVVLQAVWTNALRGFRHCRRAR
jgi:hypothetical protein